MNDLEKTAPRIAYIAGSGRSGSTLLDMMLGCNSDAQSIGEIDNVRHRILTDETCTCRALLRNCPFWAKVLEKYAASPTQLPGILDATTFKQKVVELMRGILLGRLPEPDPGNEKKAWRLLDATLDVSGKKLLIDSSKKSSRLIRLEAENPHRMFVIHLVRDIKGVYRSTSKDRRIELIHGGTQVQRQLPKPVASLNWVVHNVLLHILCRVRFRGRYAVVDYGNLVRHPEATLGSLCQKLGLEFSSDMLPPLSSKTFHNVGGNYSRYGGYDKLKLDERWKKDLTRWEILGNNLLGGWFYSYLRSCSINSDRRCRRHASPLRGARENTRTGS